MMVRQALETKRRRDVMPLFRKIFVAINRERYKGGLSEAGVTPIRFFPFNARHCLTSIL